MADSHLATRRNSNSALPRLRPPRDRRKERGKCLLISRISGDREKKICLMRPRDVSLSREREKKKKLSGSSSPRPPHLSTSKRRPGRKTDKGTTNARVQMCFAHTEALRACSLRQLLAGYRKVSRCYLDQIKSILTNKLDIAAGGGNTRRLRRPPKFNSVHLR